MTQECPNCGKELKWHEGYTAFYNNKKFCNMKCAREYKKSPKYHSEKALVTEKTPELKKQILEELKKEELKRQTELELHDKKPTKTDIKRQEKIRQLEEELKPSAGLKLAGGGFIGAASLAMTGFAFLVIGAILTISVIGAVIGVPLMVIGVILVILGGWFGIIGIGGGAAVGIGEAIHKSIKKSKKEK